MVFTKSTSGLATASERAPEENPYGLPLPEVARPWVREAAVPASSSEWTRHRGCAAAPRGGAAPRARV